MGVRIFVPVLYFDVALLIMNNLLFGFAVLSAAIWVGLLTVWGQFWCCNQRLDDEVNGSPVSASPALIVAVIPARNEADMIPKTLRSLLTQDYDGDFQIVLVDDQSTDGTGAIANQTALKLGVSERLKVISGKPLPDGWTGKLWAMEQGVRDAQSLEQLPDYFLFTDADIHHDRANLRQLVTKAQQENLDLVSLMVLLRCQSFWEKLLIPAFVFFFQKLYPFPLVNDPGSRIAAAAGGCALIRREALMEIGGIQVLRQALIDDCSLAREVKFRKGIAENRTAERQRRGDGKIWLGLTQVTTSLRAYESLQTIWDMVARTAYTQLNYSPLLLAGTVVGMTLIYLVAPLSLAAGLALQDWRLALAGLAGWLLMAIAYLPTILLYRLNPGWALALPLIALLYNLMTIDSALRHWRGQGGAWKGRVYSR